MAWERCVEQLVDVPSRSEEAVKDEANRFMVREFIGVQREILDGLRSAGYRCCRKV